MSDEIILVPYDPGWPHLYALARDELLALLPEPPVLIEHIGSTAIPGLLGQAGYRHHRSYRGYASDH